MTAIPPLLRDKQTSLERAENDAGDRAGLSTPPRRSGERTAPRFYLAAVETGLASPVPNETRHGLQRGIGCV
jgi:hypothetical protein